MQQKADASYKIVLVGDSGVGKTNLLASFIARQEEVKRKGRSVIAEEETKTKLSEGYSERHQPTIGCEFYSASIKHPTDGSVINLQIWDTAGQERYRAITPGHYRRAAGALLVYDVTHRQSLDSAVTSWFHELESWPLSDCLALVGNKMDLYQEGNPTHVSKQEHVEATKRIMAVSSNRASAKCGTNVYEAFMQLVFKIHEKAKEQQTSEYDKSISLSYMRRALDDGHNPSDQCKCAT